MDQFDELIQFLAPDGRKDVKSASCMTVARKLSKYLGMYWIYAHFIDSVSVSSVELGKYNNEWFK